MHSSPLSERETPQFEDEPDVTESDDEDLL